MPRPNGGSLLDYRRDDILSALDREHNLKMYLHGSVGRILTMPSLERGILTGLAEPWLGMAIGRTRGGSVRERKYCGFTNRMYRRCPNRRRAEIRGMFEWREASGFGNLRYISGATR
jgi:hypothetical protein